MKKIAADRNYRMFKEAGGRRDPGGGLRQLFDKAKKEPSPSSAQNPLTEVLKLKREMDILKVRVDTLEKVKQPLN